VSNHLWFVLGVQSSATATLCDMPTVSGRLSCTRCLNGLLSLTLTLRHLHRAMEDGELWLTEAVVLQQAVLF
jgi:hypothetical protein